MKEIKPELETFARIKVVGVGGSGNHAISRMQEANLKGIEFIAVNSDAQDLHHCKIAEKIHIGKNLTRGLGAGMNPDVGRQAAEENKDELQDALKNADMVFVTCGLGGGTGTGAAPIIAEAARDAGALTVAVVTKPFAFEGMQRKKIAEEGLKNLRANVDTIITIPNDKIFQVIDKKTPLLDSFKIVDDVLRQAVQGISDLITIPGIVNVDFADVKAIMQNTGPALMGIGRASGENRAADAAKQAINSPLLELSIHGAKGILFNISGGTDLTMMEVNEAAQIITESVDPSAKVIFGAITDEDLKKGEVKITVIATGFQNSDEPVQKANFVRPLNRPVEPVMTRSEPVLISSSKIFEDEKEKEPEEKVKPTVIPLKKNLSSSIGSVFKKEVREKKEEIEKEPVKEEVKENILPTPVKPVVEEKKEDFAPSRPFSSKISNITYNDEYDIPAFLRKKMNKNKNDSE